MATQNVDLIAGTKITLGTNSDTYLLTMKNLGAVYQQSAKIDFGANWASLYNVILSNKFGSAPTAGLTMDLWIGYSDSGTAATNNWASCTGADAAYTGLNTDPAASVLRLDRIGSMKLSNHVGPQTGIVGSFTPRARYGYLVWLNGSGQTTTNVDADHQIQLWPVLDRIEAAVA
jgi:hypothetical protein